jgi:hypothetical protein
VLHASAISRARDRSSSFNFAPGRGRSTRAGATPASAQRRRVRSTVEGLTKSTAAISSAVWPSSLNSRIRARVSFRVACRPLSSSPFNSSRSDSVNTIRYFSMMPSSEKQLAETLDINSPPPLPLSFNNQQNQLVRLLGSLALQPAAWPLGN